MNASLYPNDEGYQLGMKSGSNLVNLYLSELMKIYMTTPHMLRNEGVQKEKYGGVCVPDKILHHDEEEK